jgi:outer membrane protein assembly factor BamB
VTARNLVHGLDGATGEARWTATLAAPLSARPHAGQEEVYLPLSDGTLWAVSPAGQLVLRGRAGTASLASPLVVGIRAICGDASGTLSMLDSRRSTAAWTFRSPAPIAATPCIVGGKLLFATVKGTFYFMELLP